MADALTEILRAAGKHPNSRVSKLIHTVEGEPTQKNIVLLLIELAEHAEYSTDFNVSLKYYLDLFERLGINHDLVLNEAGLLLVNSSKIYSKRVDYVQSLVERQILTLSNADDELQKQKLEQQQDENATPTEKPKRGRKRALEVPSNPYEVELAPKKFKKLTEEKRFAHTKTPTKPKSLQRNIEMEQHIHPAGWLHATIYDLENEEDVDTKRNYKLFTYHVEHRYNTLVPDINFRLHFKVKDYMDEQEEMEDDEACSTDRSWPPLSEAYVQKYLRLENYVLQQDIKANNDVSTEIDVDKTQENLSTFNQTKEQNMMDVNNSQEEVTRNKTMVETLDASSINGKNESGLGQSILDETANNILNSTQLNSTLETTANLTNLSDVTLSEANKSLNISNTQQENDSALGTSICEQINNTDNNTTANLETTATLNETNLTETENQLKNDSALGSSLLDQTSNMANNTTIATSEPTNTSQDTLAETINDTSTIMKTHTKEVDDTRVNDTATETKLDHADEFSKATENRKDSALSDDRHYSISTENLAMSRESLLNIDNDTGKTLEINVKDQQDKDATQIRIQLPHTDDEGVCLSDLEDHNDMRLLSPVVKATNILPGVTRKDVTIHMDEELRKALEIRDGIMEHFGPETYKVPVVIEPKKQNLIFNILKLPEKLVRRKILFKLEPDMDLYLQARSLKRSRIEPVTRTNRNLQFLQVYSLNNTDMSGVYMTPPNSPDHCSNFCGFSDDDDTMSCVDFCGFTEEEQATMMVKHGNRLSRDSGVGVDVNLLTPEKEPLEIIFENAESAAIEKCKRNINLDETPSGYEESIEDILTQLPEDIVENLTAALEENNKSETEPNPNATESNSEPTEDNSQTEEGNSEALTNAQESEELCTESCIENTEESEQLCTENSSENLENILTENFSTNNTQEPSNAELTEELSELPISTEQSTEHSETLTINEYQDSETTDLTTAAVISDEAVAESVESSKNAEDLLREKLNLANSMEESDHYDEHHGDMEDNDSDDEMLDLDSQGIKTKIQQWHEHLQPILAKSRERHHFDVFKLGTEIIDTVQTVKSQGDFSNEFQSTTESPKSPAVASFHDVMDNKDQSYVSRYFLSTLLLANQSNVEIFINNKSSEKPSSWHDIQIKLLNTKRHTVAIEDNIGMLDNKQKSADKNVKSNVKEKQKRTARDTELDEDEEEDENSIKLQNTKKSHKKLKTSIKRSGDNTKTSPTVEKKPKQLTPTITNNRVNYLPNLIESVQIIKPLIDTDVMMTKPTTSRQAHNLTVNMNPIRTLQPIEKVHKRSDDYDSGIFSVDEMSTS